MVTARPPEKLAVSHPSYRRYAGRLRIFLDGYEIERCTAFDVRQGYVRRQRVDARGQRILLLSGIAEEMLHGRVEVQWK